MFKIHDDKVYFVAETPDINKVIEIFLPKDDRGTIMDSHEIRVDLCRAVIHMEKKGVRVLKVRNIEDTNKASIDIWHMPEYQEAAESPVSDVVNACIESCFDSAFLLLHLRKNLQSYNKKTIKKDFPQFKMLHDKTKERLQNSHEWLPCSVGF